MNLLKEYQSLKDKCDLLKDSVNFYHARTDEACDAFEEAERRNDYENMDLYMKRLTYYHRRAKQDLQALKKTAQLLNKKVAPFRDNI